MQALRLAIALVGVLGLAGCGSDQETVMPDVTGQQLDVALSDIEGAGFEDDVEVVGGGTFGVVDKSNWQVCEQSPAAGQEVVAGPRLTVDRSCGGNASEPATPSTETTAGPSDQPSEGPNRQEPDEGEAEEILTVENNEDLAALLVEADYCADTIEGFAAKYQGRTIAFDGSVDALNNHDNYDTRYDILVTAGDYSETSSIGPSFQFRDVNMFDLHLTGADVPDSLGAGDNLHIVAQVGEFSSTHGCLFLLDPISTEVR